MAAPTTSANFSWLLPTEGASSGVWDTFLNDVVSGTTANSDPFDGIDKVVGDIKTTADAALPTAGSDSPNANDAVMTGQIDIFTERYETVSLSGSGTQTINMDAANAYYVTPSATITFVFTNAGNNHFEFVQIEITNGAAQTVNWPSSVDWPGGTEPTLSAGVDLITGYTRDGGTTWRLAIAMANSS